MELRVYLCPMNLNFSGKFQRFASCLLLSAWLYPACAQKKGSAPLQVSQWVDSVMATLSQDEKIGQLFMIPVYSNKDLTYQKSIAQDIRKYAVGGVIFMQGGPVRQALLTNELQKVARLPLLVAMDAEWGLGMRLKDSAISFPRQMVLGALPNDSLVFEMGLHVARHCKRLGVHINFAPVVDINNNPANPVIGMRSFGEDKYKVAQWGSAYARGLQSGGVIACAKHFPGHGDTDKDSHHTLPTLSHSRQRFDSLELFPFRQLIADSVMAIMAGHLFVPAYDDTPNLASSLSKKVVTGLLQDSLKFKGLVFTDALDMKGVSQHFKPGDSNVAALLAGNSVLLFPGDLAEAKAGIDKALAEGKITMAEIENRVRLILKAKYFVGLNRYKPIEIQNLYSQINDPLSLALKRKIYASAITVVRNDSNFLPVKSLAEKKIVAIGIGASGKDIFLQRLASYAPMQQFSSTKGDFALAVEKRLSESLKKADLTIIGLHNVGNSDANTYDLPASLRSALSRLNSKKNIVLVIFGNPYSLKYFDNQKTLVCAYDDSEEAQDLAAQIIFGAIPARGKLPVSSGKFSAGQGFDLGSLKRLRFGLPEEVGMDSKKLAQVDSIALRAIAMKATPGCQVLAAKNGMVVYQKAFGFMDYQGKDSVTNLTLYDIASISKVAGTLQAAMMLHSKGLFDTSKKLKDYLPKAAGTNKADANYEDILTHQAGFQPFLPLFDVVFRRRNPDPRYIRTQPSDSFNIQVCDETYARTNIKDWITDLAFNSSLTRHRNKYGRIGYLYSDLGFFFLQLTIEALTGQSLDKFLETQLFSRLGLTYLCYNPLQHGIARNQIAPSEFDYLYRNQIIRGYVHDPMASLQGGVGGHAGLFANSLSLAVIFQMNLQGGEYGGERFISPQTLNKFNSRPNAHNDNRRGLGWDKPLMPKQSGDSPTSDYCSQATFGHTGFTGTCAWADPENQLIYIFLSNRTFPTAENRKLARHEFRTQIQDAIYRAIIK